MPTKITVLPPAARPVSGKILKLQNWPPADRHIWTTASFNGVDILERQSMPNWGEATREIFQRCYGGWLQWLVETGRMCAVHTPADRVTKANVGAFLRDRQTIGNNYRTLETYATSLRHMMRVLAPELEWSWMLPCIDKMKAAQPKKKAMSDLPSIQELFELGIALMETADKDTSGTVRERAFMYRNGLAIAMLAARAFMRRKNFAGIVIGKNLIRDEIGYALYFGKDEMKQNREISMFLPKMLTPMIDRYLDFYRPALLSGKPDPGNALWISHVHKRIVPKSLSVEIAEITKAAFGKRISVHKFRHCTATSIAKLDPTNVLMVPTILFHTDFKVGEKYYIFAEAYTAFDQLGKTLDHLAATPAAA
jgi:integrase/recombinase XerD